MSEAREQRPTSLGRPDPGAEKKFVNILASDATYGTTLRAFRGFFNYRNDQLSNDSRLRVGFATNCGPFGVVDTKYGTAEDPDRMLVITHPNFPSFLEDHAKFAGPITAYHFAARYVVAFGLIQRGRRRYTAEYEREARLNMHSKDGLNRKLWHPDYLGPQGNGLRAAPYRAAACVAMSACDITGVQLNIDFGEQTDHLPPQIASLLNPHTANAVGALREIALSNKDASTVAKPIFRI